MTVAKPEGREAPPIRRRRGNVDDGIGCRGALGGGLLAGEADDTLDRPPRSLLDKEGGVGSAMVVARVLPFSRVVRGAFPALP